VPFLLPLVFLIGETLANWGEAGRVVVSARTLGPLTRSLVIATTASLGAGLVGTATAWVLHRIDVPGRRWLRILAPLPLVIPSFVGATALRFAFGPGGLVPFVPRLEGFLGAWLAMVFFTYPYVYLPVAARIRNLPPSIEEAARLLGGDRRRVFRTVVWPQLVPTVAAGSLLVFLYALSDFGAVSIMRYDTLTRAIFSARLAAPTTALALGFVLAVVALLVAGAQRSARERGRTGTDASRGLARAEVLSPGPRVAVVIPLAAVLLGLVAPLAAFVTWWVRGTLVSGGGVGAFAGTLAELAAPAFNSAMAGSLAAVIAIVVLLPGSFVAARHTDRLGKLIQMVTAATFALPGVVVAFAIVFWVVRAPDLVFSLYQTLPLLIAAYVVHFGAQALQPMTLAVRSTPESVVEAAGTLGAAPIRRLRTIQLPLMMPGLAAGGGLVLLSVLKELPATLLLAPIGFSTLATKVWGAAEEGFLAQAGAASLVLIAVSGALSWVLILRDLEPGRPRRARLRR
jgi:iron(III) transport system permease protein